jgi:hypothetical protein
MTNKRGTTNKRADDKQKGMASSTPTATLL